jgi:hypothetical protein
MIADNEIYKNSQMINYYYGFVDPNDRMMNLGQFTCGIAGVLSYDRIRYCPAGMWATTPEAKRDADAITNGTPLTPPSQTTIEREAKQMNELVHLFSLVRDAEVENTNTNQHIQHFPPLPPSLNLDVCPCRSQVHGNSL